MSLLLRAESIGMRNPSDNALVSGKFISDSSSSSKSSVKIQIKYQIDRDS